MGVEPTAQFFTTFFNLPTRQWRGFLGSSLTSLQLLVFAGTTFAWAPWPIKVRAGGLGDHPSGISAPRLGATLAPGGRHVALAHPEPSPQQLSPHARPPARSHGWCSTSSRTRREDTSCERTPTKPRRRRRVRGDPAGRRYRPRTPRAACLRRASCWPCFPCKSLPLREVLRRVAWECRWRYRRAGDSPQSKHATPLLSNRDQFEGRVCGGRGRGQWGTYVHELRTRVRVGPPSPIKRQGGVGGVEWEHKWDGGGRERGERQGWEGDEPASRRAGVLLAVGAWSRGERADTVAMRAGAKGGRRAPSARSPRHRTPLRTRW